MDGVRKVEGLVRLVLDWRVCACLEGVVVVVRFWVLEGVACGSMGRG